MELNGHRVELRPKTNEHSNINFLPTTAENVKEQVLEAEVEKEEQFGHASSERLKTSFEIARKDVTNFSLLKSVFHMSAIFVYAWNDPCLDQQFVALLLQILM